MSMQAIDRREFLGVLAALPLAAKAAQAQTIPIIDAHIHMFDRNKPGGTFYPRADDPVPGVSALPARYRGVIKPFGVVGAIVVEASPWLEENQWILDQAASDSIIVGYVGFIYPGTPEFSKHLERFHKNNLFRGIRYSNRENRKGYDIAEAVDNPQFISDLKLLADAGLTLDIAMTPDPNVLVRLTDKVPSLRVIVPHLPNARMPEERAALDKYLASLRELASRPRVYTKLSEVIKRVDGKASTDPSLYRERLDLIWSIFGENRMMFGSDWPNSEHVGSINDVMSVARGYINSKGTAAAEKVYWRNSAAAYRWVKRDPSQPQA
jgi:predicted TIM-barrel fold metal-dependent hydrolase